MSIFQGVFQINFIFFMKVSLLLKIENDYNEKRLSFRRKL